MPLDLPFPFTLPRLFRSPAISNFFFFPWDFEIAGFDCILMGNRVRVKSSGIAPGLQMPGPRGLCAAGIDRCITRESSQEPRQ